MRSLIAITGFTIVLTALVLVPAPHTSAIVANDTEALNTSVNIKVKTIVDIAPSSLAWTDALPPGGEGERKDIQIQNLGSVNITHVWINNSVPSENPFGANDKSLWDAGNWIAVSQDSATSRYYFPSRKEFNASSRIVFLTGPTGNTPPNHPYGKFRNTSFEYFWSVDCGSGNCTDGSIYIGDTPRTQTQAGDTDLSDNAGTGLSVVEGGEWGYASVTFNGHDICVAVNRWANVTRWYKWNIDAPGAEDCESTGNAAYFVDDSVSALTPGESAYARVRAFVPFGVQFDPQPFTGRITVSVNTL